MEDIFFDRNFTNTFCYSKIFNKLDSFFRFILNSLHAIIHINTIIYTGFLSNINNDIVKNYQQWKNFLPTEMRDNEGTITYEFLTTYFLNFDIHNPNEFVHISLQRILTPGIIDEKKWTIKRLISYIFMNLILRNVIHTKNNKSKKIMFKFLFEGLSVEAENIIDLFDDGFLFQEMPLFCLAINNLNTLKGKIISSSSKHDSEEYSLINLDSTSSVKEKVIAIMYNIAFITLGCKLKINDAEIETSDLEFKENMYSSLSDHWKKTILDKGIDISKFKDDTMMNFLSVKIFA